MNFHAALMNERDRAEAERDRGVAFCHDGREGATMALPLLEKALARHPDDAIAWESKAGALQQLGRDQQAFVAYQEALKRDPNRESTIEGAAGGAARSGRHSDAVVLWRRAIALNPWRPHHYSELARAAARLGDWPAVIESSREALRLQPFDVEARRRLVQGLAARRRGSRTTRVRYARPIRAGATRGAAPMVCIATTSTIAAECVSPGELPG